MVKKKIFKPDELQHVISVKFILKMKLKRTQFICGKIRV